jgi:hypothetical protein
LDVSARRVGGVPWSRIALPLVLLLALALRLKGLHAPLLDHPGWRQGDTAAIARNFATLQYNPFFPQTEYNGPPPNYVELELQIVPFLAATLYKLFGVHEVFGRLISIAFSLGTVAVLFFFARRLFTSSVAGIVAATLYAIYPGAIYYGRTFMPDTTMAFFLTAAIYASYVWLEDAPAERSRRKLLVAALLTAAAFLAKPVAVIAIVPIGAYAVASLGIATLARRWETYAFAAIAFVPLAVYDRIVSSHAEWHWASQITRLHVVPGLVHAFTSLAAFDAKLDAFRHALVMLGTTMLGPIGLGLFVIGFLVLPRNRAPALLYGWLAAAALYTYVVVTVERVDYYLFPVLPLAALVGGGFIAELVARATDPEGHLSRATSIALAVALVVTVAVDRAEIAPYYAYSSSNYRALKRIDARLAPNALVVMGHDDPTLLYYMHRKGWEEDAYLWTPFDEQSAIRKGARYFIAVEPARLKRNVELSAWLARFPVIRDKKLKWPIYETDYAKMLPGAEARWQEFRRREKAGLLPGSKPPDAQPPDASP